MTTEELIAYQAKEREFATTTIGKAFRKYQDAAAAAYHADARLEYLDQGATAAKTAWVKCNEAETELRKLLDEIAAHAMGGTE